MVSAAAATDWGATPLGAACGWPAELRTAVSICLNSHFPMAVAWGPDLVYLYNDAAIPIFGVKHPSALGQRVADVWPEAWPTIGPLLESVLASGVANRGDDLLLVLERNGFAEECYLTFSYSPIMTACGVPGGVFVTFMQTNDSSQRKLAEQALREAHGELEQRVLQRTEELRAAKQLLSAVFDRAPGGIVITAMPDNFIRANAAYQQLTGYSEAELMHQPLSGRTEPEDFAQLQAGRARLLAGACDTFRVDIRYRRADGNAIWVSNFESLLERGQDDRVYFVSLTTDITERKRAEAAMHASQRELRMLYDHLQTVRESERTALAREVHDQLGQILSAARIDIKLLEDQLRAPVAPSRVHLLAELGSASGTLERAIGLVREIATELRSAQLDEHGLYRAIAWHGRDFERRTRIPCRLALDAGQPRPAQAAAAALLRICQEALTNVLRHAQAGEVRVSLGRRGKWLLLRVRDDGVGIDRRGARGAHSLGIRGMRERATLAGGRLLVGPLRPRGTLVSARVPLEEPPAPAWEGCA